jgi:enterochelin esterase-like enzyme
MPLPQHGGTKRGLGIMNARVTVGALLLSALSFVATSAWSQSAPSAPQARPALGPPPASAGKYERVSVHGASLEGNLEGDSADRMVSVYLPPSYAKEPRRRYPVLYLLHGYTDSDARWFGLAGKHFLNVQASVDKAYAKGARELIIVMPDAFTKYAGSMYSSSVTTGDWEGFVTHDLVAYVDKHYRTLAKRASRGLAGHSMGGYGTVRIGMKYPGVFSSLYALSPCCMGASLEPNAETAAQAASAKTPEQFDALGFGAKAMIASAAAWSPNPHTPPYFDLPRVDGKAVPDTLAKWAANAPLAMVHQYVPNLKKYSAIAVDAGDRDTGIAATVKELDQILTGYGVKHVAEIYSGDHVDHIGERLETKVLPFFSEHLAFK